MPERAREATAARPAPLADDEVWVWLAPLDVEAAAVDGLAAVLSPEERARAARFHFRRDALRWMAARATLRAILGAYLHTDPAAIAFTYGPRGKPALAADGVRPSPQFSVSHAADLAAVAVAAGAPVGVDVEQQRTLHDLEQIAARSFSARECRALRDLPPAQRPAGFFNCWTRKEAYIKALGEGLSYPLGRFSVSLAPGLPARLEMVDDAPGEVDAWTMAALPVPAGFAGAVVVRRPGARVRCEWWERGR